MLTSAKHGLHTTPLVFVSTSSISSPSHLAITQSPHLSIVLFDTTCAFVFYFVVLLSTPLLLIICSSAKHTFITDNL